jgi:hypothetical protein
METTTARPLDLVNAETLLALLELTEEMPTFQDCKDAETFKLGERVQAIGPLNHTGLVVGHHYRLYDGNDKFHLSIWFDNGTRGSWPPDELRHLPNG